MPQFCSIAGHIRVREHGDLPCQLPKFRALTVRHGFSRFNCFSIVCAIQRDDVREMSVSIHKVNAITSHPIFPTAVG